MWPGSGRVLHPLSTSWSGDILMAEYRFSPWRCRGNSTFNLIPTFKSEQLQGMSVLARVTSFPGRNSLHSLAATNNPLPQAPGHSFLVTLFLLMFFYLLPLFFVCSISLVRINALKLLLEHRKSSLVFSRLPSHNPLILRS